MSEIVFAVLLWLTVAVPPPPPGQAAEIAALEAPHASRFAGVTLVRRSTPSDPVLVAELIHAIQTDPEFGHGAEARERAILALARTTNAGGFYAFEHEGQAAILVEGITLQEGATQIDIVSVAHLLPAAVKPVAVESLHRLLTQRDDPFLIMETVSALGRMGEIAADSAAPIRLLLEDPARARPELWREVAHLDTQREGPSISSQLRLRAALARIQFGKLREDMADLYPRLDREGRIAAAHAIAAWLLEARGKPEEPEAVVLDALRFLQTVHVGQDFEEGFGTGGVMAILLIVEHPEVIESVKRQAAETFATLCPPGTQQGESARIRLRQLGYLPTDK